MTTMRDVAKKAGVGVGTVSRALSDTGYTAKATREKIFAAAKWDTNMNPLAGFR